jgi:outer membrane receptor protein involved in Fe transport
MKLKNISAACLSFLLWHSHAQAQSTQVADAAQLTELPDVVVISTSPLGTAGIAVKQYAGNVQTINNADLPQDANTLTDVLNESIGAININDTQGNPYQADLNYRGFTASPVLGTPQGISVFMDGMRMNEPFGDVVSWDLIPQIAISNVTLIPGSNPVYGLNTLGGALSMNTKSGFQYSSSDAKVTAGSFGRISTDIETGGHSEYTDYYLATSLYNDKGWALYNPSSVRQFFGKFGFQDEVRDLDLSIMYSDNMLHGNQTVPVSMLSNATAGYSHSDYSSTQNFALNLKGTIDLDDEHALSGNVYYRHIKRGILNSNISTSTVAGSVNGCDPLTNCPAANILTDYTQDIYGLNVQHNTKNNWHDLPQNLTLGLNYEFASTTLTNLGQDAYVDSTQAVVGVDSFSNQAVIGSTNRRLGLFATDTLQATEKLALTASARWDRASVELTGNSCSNFNAQGNLAAPPYNGLCNTGASGDTTTAVTGNNSYQRLNPSFGATYQLATSQTAFASYSEGFRTPSAIELACADPSAPCAGLPNAFGADPYLKPVISKTIKLGMRGNNPALNWKTAVFMSHLYDDIYFNQTNATQGYFSNVGQTRRQGLELALNGKQKNWDYAWSMSYVQATFQSGFDVANSSNQNQTIHVQAGDRMPSIPALTLKTSIGFKPNAQTRYYMGLQAQSAQYARGDENNVGGFGQVPDFVTAKLGFSHTIDSQIQVFGNINNLFNTQYANYGVLAANNLAGGNDEQFRSIGMPRSLSMGLKYKF